ncbi:MAG: alpha/beta hydrolase [Sphingomonas adhaesiva]|uniref:alpha/beta hydrolase n=1 Tax=Sphingomonas adhaesiva TaxID=28212 RepID=UPI002FF86339
MRRMMNHVALAALIATPLAAAAAQVPVPHFAPAPTPVKAGEITLSTPRSRDLPAENWFRDGGYYQVRNVGQATLLPFIPPANLATGEAVIVAPGGGFRGLAIENEGWAVAQALADRGIAAFVLKYRLLPTPTSFDAFRDGVAAAMVGKPSAFPPPADTPDRALEDAAAGLRYVRAHADDYGIDPARVGMMGFSAGAFLTLTTVLKLPPADRPAFIAPIYPRMTARDVPADAPPMFVAIAADDFLMDPSLGLISSWYRAKRPVEFHLYQQAGHGFGLGRPGTSTAGWFDAFLRWREQNRRLATTPKR